MVHFFGVRYVYDEMRIVRSSSRERRQVLNTLRRIIGH